MPAHSVRLVYPPSLLGRPVIQELIQRFELAVNIRRAQITLEEGWIELDLTGETTEFERAVEWLRGEGLDIENPA